MSDELKQIALWSFKFAVGNQQTKESVALEDQKTIRKCGVMRTQPCCTVTEIKRAQFSLHEVGC